MKRIILALSCALLSQLAVASYYAQDGISSMMLRSAELLPEGQKMLDLSVFLDGYDVPGGTDADATILSGAAYGFSESLSLGLAAPVVVVTNSLVGLRELNGVVKYRLGGSRDDGVEVALSGFASLLSGSSVGTGEGSYGLALNISLYGDVTTLNLSLGGEKSDLKTAGVSSGFSGEQQLMLAGGIEFRPRDKWQYLLEGVFTRTNDEDNNFLLMPGLRYTPDQRMSFYAGAAFGLPSGKSKPEWRLTSGVRVNIGAKAKAKAKGADDEQVRRQSPMRPMTALVIVREPVTAALSSQATSGAILDSGLESAPVVAAGAVASVKMSAVDALMLEQMEALRSEVSALISAPPSVIARVEIQNASGIRGLGEKVAKLLTQRGYSIVSISDVARPVERATRVYYKAGPKNAEIVRVDRARLGVRKQTRIYFIEGFQQRATRVSLALPGSQRVMSDTELVNVAEIRLVIGKDMKALLMRRPIKQPST